MKTTPTADKMLVSTRKAYGKVLDHLVASIPPDTSFEGLTTEVGRMSYASFQARFMELWAHGCTPDQAADRVKALHTHGDLAPVPAALVRQEYTPLIAAGFALSVHEYATKRLIDGERRYQEMLQNNKAETDPSICHTHDLCDANVFMASSIEADVGVDPAASEDLLNDAAMIDLWNAAWDLAKSNYLGDIPAARQLCGQASLQAWQIIVGDDPSVAAEQPSPSN